MSSIGPYSSFSTMEGRLLTASQPTIPGTRGLRVGKRRPRPSSFRTIETHANAVDAWIQAYYYRSAIGGVTSVVDDGGIRCDVALINDVRTLVRALGDGAGFVLETAWLIVPAVTFGDYGQATSYMAIETQTLTPVSQPARPVTSSTAITVGGISFTTATGDLQWPISGAQMAGVVRAAKGIGADEVVSEPSPSQGTLSCTVGSLSETTAFDLMRAVRSLVGTFAAVDLGGITIPAVAVADADVSWRTVVGLPSSQTRLVQVDWTLETQDETGGDTDRVVSLVQVATSWGSWQTVRGAVCEVADEGVGGVAGRVNWTLNLGRTMRGGRAVTAEATDHSGKWCRIVTKRNASGQPDPRGTTLDPTWHGVVMSTELMTGGGASATMQSICHGVQAAMDQMWLTRWYEVGLGSATADPGEVLAMNGQLGGDGGSTGDGALTGLTIHDRARTPPKRWTALEMVNTLLRAYEIEYPNGPRFALGGQTSALAYAWTAELKGRSFLAQLAELITPKRNVTWRPEVSGSTITIRVASTLATALTGLPGADQPVNDRLVPSLSLIGDDIRATLRRDRSQQVDHGLFEGGRAWLCASFGFGTGAMGNDRESQLAKGWTTGTNSQEVTWDAATDIARESDELGMVWRRYVLKPDFAGRSWAVGSVGANDSGPDVTFMGRTVNADGWETGAFQRATASGADAVQVKPENIRFSRELPIAKGVNWETVTSSSASAERPKGQLEGPLLIGFNPASITYENLTDRWQIQVEDDSAAVILGRNVTDAKEIKAYLDAGKVLIFTLGLYHPLPWRYSWRRATAAGVVAAQAAATNAAAALAANPADAGLQAASAAAASALAAAKADAALRPRDLERTHIRSFPEMIYRSTVPGTIVGITSSTALKVAPSPTVLIDWDVGPATGRTGRSRLEVERTIGKQWQDSPLYALSWTETGVIDTGTTKAPTALVQSVTLRIDAARTWPETVNVLITGRSWNFKVGEVSTTWNADRTLPGFERFSLANPAPDLHFGGQMAGGYK